MHVDAEQALKEINLLLVDVADSHGIAFIVCHMLSPKAAKRPNTLELKDDCCQHRARCALDSGPSYRLDDNSYEA